MCYSDDDSPMIKIRCNVCKESEIPLDDFSFLLHYYLTLINTVFTERKLLYPLNYAISILDAI